MRQGTQTPEAEKEMKPMKWYGLVKNGEITAVQKFYYEPTINDFECATVEGAEYEVIEVTVSEKR